MGSSLTINQLRELLDYNPETGLLFWKPRSPDMFADTGSGGAEGACARWNGRCAGKEAGAQRADGYVFVNVRAHKKTLGRYSAHQLAFAFTHGRWADADIDHIDGNPSNNKADNLRDVSRSINMRNARRKSNNKSGVNGVHWNKRSELWCAQIKVNNQTIHLGTSRDFEVAVGMRKEAEEAHEFTERHGE